MKCHDVPGDFSECSGGPFWNCAGGTYILVYDTKQGKDKALAQCILIFAGFCGQLQDISPVYGLFPTSALQ